ncbi:hypothetical protein GGP41_010659 [Bipolaris sorokiniana]|uniref:BRCT domain-containing protein n=1 Tax=Cochliobolus sativus TaxID=45130 RepID=A0A8H6DX16_COCSA|nr:hypothetical protein GGP41_010659 [Bipolaris sorokiniana]
MAGRSKKKGTSGAAKNYITRTRAVKKLQISLPDFRRLCIFKGIYPREPRNKKKVSRGSTAATTFYYTKDIQYLLHEPLLAKFREHKAVAKKIGRALGRGEAGDASRLEKNLMPKVKLDHIIKERYPTFFYTTLLGFVNYRLYTSVGLVYPPKFNAKSDEQGGELSAFQLQGKVNATNGTANGHAEHADINPEAQAIADKLAAMPDDEDAQDSTALAKRSEDDEEEANDEIDKFEPTAPDADILPQPQASSAEVASLFAPFTFYLSRETPRAPLEFILKAFGCKRVGWDGTLGDGAFTTNESDPNITHQIVDRPALSNEASTQNSKNGDAAAPKAQWPYSMMPGRTYVQPQWVWDCINQSKLLRPDHYAPGADLPPHLSPWVKPKKGEYDPNLPLAAQQPEGEAEAFEDEDGEDAAKLEVKKPTKKEQNAAIRKKAEKKRREQEEERERQKMMLSNKKRKLLKRIEYGENKRDNESENLRRKRAKVEKAKAAAEAL